MALETLESENEVLQSNLDDLVSKYDAEIIRFKECHES